MTPEEYTHYINVRRLTMPTELADEIRLSMTTSGRRADRRARVAIESALKDAVFEGACRMTGACALCAVGVTCAQVNSFLSNGDPVPEVTETEK